MYAAQDCTSKRDADLYISKKLLFIANSKGRTFMPHRDRAWAELIDYHSNTTMGCRNLEYR